MIKRDIKDDFLDLFYHDLKSEKLINNNTLNLFTLKVKNNSFSYDELCDLLGNKLYYFALSRTEIQKLKDEDKLNDLIKKAKLKLRDYKSNEGELGELLLYCLLESHLDAPKILSKLEIKTSNNDYVKGTDGVHLLKLNTKDHQLIFCESKLETDISNGIYSAFNSIKTFLTTKNKVGFEIDLINSQLVKEAFDESSYDILKKIIIPSAKEDEIYLDYSFGIFLGFDIKITEDENKLSNSEFRAQIREKIKSEITSKIDSLNFQIKKHEFSGYQFYIYVVPFSNLSQIRKDIIKELTA
ncbi:DUF1837 domain-containing protein [Flavobacterium sp. LaA7.5]|nr:DUF1837 domain-containing protein [Flavobacterium salilacus subsp. altitudinum]